MEQASKYGAAQGAPYLIGYTPDSPTIPAHIRSYIATIYILSNHMLLTI